MISPTAYELRVAGHLDDHWAAWFDDLTLARHADGTTVLTGPVADQAQLHGILARVRDLGVPLLSVRITESAACPRAGHRGDAPGSASEPDAPPTHARHTLWADTADDADPTWA